MFTTMATTTSDGCQKHNTTNRTFISHLLQHSIFKWIQLIQSGSVTGSRDNIFLLSFSVTSRDGFPKPQLLDFSQVLIKILASIKVWSAWRRNYRNFCLKTVLQVKWGNKLVICRMNRLICLEKDTGETMWFRMQAGRPLMLNVV